MTLKQILLSGLWASMTLTGCLSGREGPEPEPSPPSNAGSDNLEPSPSAGSTLTSGVSGTRVLHYRTDTGDFSEPVSPSTAPLQAFVVESGARRYLTLSDPGDGTFSIPDAPVGSYFLQLGSTYVFTDARSLSLDRYELGRRGRAVASAVPTARLSVSNFSPVPDGSTLDLDVDSSNLGVWTSLIGSEPITAGTTSVTGYVSNWYENNPEYTGTTTSVVDGTKGDLIHLNQKVSRSDGVISYSAVDRSLVPAPFTLSMDPAAPSTISGTFQQLPVRTAQFEWWRSRFDAFRITAHPQASQSTGFLSLSPLPWGDDAWYGYSGSLVDGTVPGSAQDLSVHLDYGNPYLSWGVALNVVQRFSVPLRLPGTTSGALGVSISDIRPYKEGMGPISLRISPPQGLTVDGASAQVDRTLASLTPTFTWKAPQVGTPSVYSIRLYRLFKSSSTSTITRYTSVASFITPGTSLTVPPGLMVAGERYVLSVYAYLTPGVDYAKQPFVLEVLTDAASATTVSSVLTAPTGMSLMAGSPAAPDESATVEARESNWDGRAHLNPKADRSL